MSPFQVYRSSSTLLHKPFPTLLERSTRITALEKAIADDGFRIQSVVNAQVKELLRVHTYEYVDLLQRMSKMNFISSTLRSISIFDSYLQYYCRVSPGSFDAMLGSVGAAFTAFDDIATGKITRAFCLVRPPGHHAGISRGEGFCLVNNVAIAAHKAKELGMRVAIIDFDRHHGNGTEEIVNTWDSEDVLFISSFQEGCKYARGRKGGVYGNSVLVPIPERSKNTELIKLYKKQVIPPLYSFKPDIILISAGFDMCDGDPLTNLQISHVGYQAITDMIVQVADYCSQGRVISVLEGGYDPNIFLLSVLAHCSSLSQ